MIQLGEFNEHNTVQNYVSDLLTENSWQFVNASDIPRRTNEVLVESYLKDALIRLNPEIYNKPDRADEVIYKLRAILLSVQSDGLVRANEEFTAWL